MSIDSQYQSGRRLPLLFRISDPLLSLLTCRSPSDSPCLLWTLPDTFFVVSGFSAHFAAAISISILSRVLDCIVFAIKFWFYIYAEETMISIIAIIRSTERVVTTKLLKHLLCTYANIISGGVALKNKGLPLYPTDAHPAVQRARDGVLVMLGCFGTVE